ncbi:MAG: fumarylacetoacetate hydrolase family protein [Actinomycetota bacterium]|nr:fumarylacetoacetate hydrolase family protein [Actinomycetota bacterium]
MTVDGADGPPSPDGAESPRLARLDIDGRMVTAVVVGDTVSEVVLSWTEAVAAFADGRSVEVAAAVTGSSVPLAQATLGAPLAPGGDVLCVGLNYRAHQAEATSLVDKVRPVPIIFAKSQRAIAAPAEPLVLPESVSEEFDWEVELGVVIGREAVAIDPDEAFDVIAGYCVMNDITARDLQHRHQQWHLGKNVPASTPMGPWVVARDSLDVPPDLQVTLRVNGVVKQRSRTSKLIHDIPALVSLLSHTTTLRPGDVIATGTPEGVGYARQPAEFLADGDIVEAEIEGVGALTNVIVTSTPAANPRPAQDRRHDDTSAVAPS